MNEFEVYGKTKLWQKVIFIIITVIGLISIAVHIYAMIFVLNWYFRIFNIITILSMMYVAYHIGYEARGKK